MRPLILIFGLILVCLLMPQGNAASKDRIYYFIPTLVDEFQTESQRMIEGVFEALGYEVISVDAGGDASRQERQVKNAILDNPVAIIVNAVDSSAIGPALDAANARHIPILVYDRMLGPNAKFDFASVSDAEAIGKLAARESIKLLGPKSGASSATILQIAGDPGDSYSLRVLQGFRSEIADNKSINVFTAVAMGWEPSNAQTIAEDFRKSHPAPNIIFAHSGDLAAAAINVFEKEIASGDVKVMAITGAPAGLDNLERGLQQLEIEQPLYAQVYGLALGLRETLDRRAGRQPSIVDGNCAIINVHGRIKENGKVLLLEGRVVTPDQLKGSGDMLFWGRLARPAESATDIGNLKCRSN
jgi:ribose transport system substrate-binding protein